MLNIIIEFIKGLFIMQENSSVDITNRQAVNRTGAEFLAACVVMAILGTLLYAQVRANSEINIQQNQVQRELQEAVYSIKEDVSSIKNDINYLHQDRQKMWEYMKGIQESINRVDNKLYNINKSNQYVLE